MPKIFVTLILIIFLMFHFDILLADDWNEVRKGIKEYKKGNSTASIEHFQKVMNRNPNDPLISYNLGDAHYQQENYEEAEKFFKRATGAKSNNLKQKSFFNLGNTYLKNKKLDEALEAYKKAIDLDPSDMTAKYNYEFAKKVKEQQQQQNQDQQDNQQKNQKKEDQEQKKEQNQDNQDNREDQKEEQQENKEKQQKNKQDENKLDKKTAEQILEALRQKEKENQKKAKMYNGKPIKVEKDW